MEGRIVGRPTLLAIYDGRLDAQGILDGLGRIGYPLEDVSVYYRPRGTDQVIDATTGQVAAGQSITEEEMDPNHPEAMQTLVLMHPNAEQATGVQQVLMSVGQAQIMYEGSTLAEGHASGLQSQNGVE